MPPDTDVQDVDSLVVDALTETLAFMKAEINILEEELFLYGKLPECFKKDLDHNKEMVPHIEKVIEYYNGKRHEL